MISLVGMALFCGQRYEATHIVVATHSSLFKQTHQCSNTFIVVQTASIDVQTCPSMFTPIHRCSENPSIDVKKQCIHRCSNSSIDVQKQHQYIDIFVAAKSSVCMPPILSISGIYRQIRYSLPENANSKLLEAFGFKI